MSKFRRFVVVPLIMLIGASCSEIRGDVIIAGTDVVPNSSSQFSLTIFGTSGFSETVSLSSGPFNIFRQLQQGLGDGTAASFIDTEIKDLTLTGVSTNVGPLSVRIGIDNGVQFGPTLGQIQNVDTTNPGAATLVGPEAFVLGDSFFDVFFEIDVGGSIFYNRDPHILAAPGITELPPIGDTHFPPASVFIYEQLIPGMIGPSDPIVGLVGGTHTPMPEPSSTTFAMLGIAMLGMARRRRT